ncbi:MAG: sugar phosphate nucleotidyltransferase [Bacteroidota bacterium]
MKIVIPMAGRGTRLRPHTLTVPKPLIPIAGKPIVHRLVEDIVELCNEPVDEIGFIIGDFGDEVEKQLHDIAESVNSKAKIFYQKEKLGTAHAILCAKEVLEGNVIVAFADTLFKADFSIDQTKDGVIWTQKVEDPRAFGVVKVNESGNITDFVEKPEEFVSDLAIIGIYYFKDGAYLRDELQYLIDNDIKDKGEYQITNALDNMKNKGSKFAPGTVKEWLDCGNKDVTVNTNQRYLEFIKDKDLVSSSAEISNSTIIEPVFIGEGVKISNSVIGPHVSVGENSEISHSVIENSIIQQNASLSNVNLENSMIGNFVEIKKQPEDLSVGDYNVIK